jgi:hypothetical protein
VLGGAVLYVAKSVEDKWLWRGGEYDKLTGLRAGFDLSFFKSQLGTPTVTRSFRGYRESAFRGRGYWVQTISRGGAVQLYAVTSCERSFHPTFLPLGSDLPVELNRSHLADIAPASESLVFDYFVGVTAPTLFYEGLYGGFGGIYKTYAWGWNSVCGGPDKGMATPNAAAKNLGMTTELTPSLEDVRRDALVNTYVETAPATFPGPDGSLALDTDRQPNLHQLHGFYVGPSWVLLQAPG